MIGTRQLHRIPIAELRLLRSTYITRGASRKGQTLWEHTTEPWLISPSSSQGYEIHASEKLANTALALADTPRPRRNYHYVPGKAKRFGLGNLSDAKSFGGSWSVQGTPARTFVSRKQREMVARSRDVIMNNDYARQFMRMFVQNVIGEDGIRFQASARKQNGTLDSDLNEALQEAWMEWGHAVNCDLSEQESFVEIQQACATSLCTDGEFFIRIHEDKSKFGLKLQVLDAQRCSPVETRKFQYARNHALYNGILFDRPTMKPVAYLFGGEHTNDNYYDDSSQKYDKIPAEEIIHGFLRERIGQHRGLPVIHTALNRTFSLDRYEESALQAARTGSGRAGFFEVDPNIGGCRGSHRRRRNCN